MSSWLEGKAKKITLYAGAAAAVLAAGAGWVSLGGPTPALSTDIEQVEERIDEDKDYGLETRSIIYNDKWLHYDQRIDDVNVKLEQNPDDEGLRALKRVLTEQKFDIEMEQKSIRDEKAVLKGNLE